MTDSYQPDLEQAALHTEISTLAARWREDAAMARTYANAPDFGDAARYQEGYADALDRVVQALRGLEDRW